jgi:hypothetical protein
MDPLMMMTLSGMNAPLFGAFHQPDKNRFLSIVARLNPNLVGGSHVIIQADDLVKKRSPNFPDLYERAALHQPLSSFEQSMLNQDIKAHTVSNALERWIVLGYSHADRFLTETGKHKLHTVNKTIFPRFLVNVQSLSDPKHFERMDPEYIFRYFSPVTLADQPLR